MVHNRFKNSGFTLIELVLSVAIIGILTGLSVPVLRMFTGRSELKSGVNLILGNLEHAQFLAAAQRNDEHWGVHIEDGEVLVFEGGSFGGRDTDFDEVMQLPQNITLGGDEDIIFEKLTGLPDSEKNITLTDRYGESVEIEINAEGVINKNE